MTGKNSNTITIYCDGACSNNQSKTNVGGWGAVLLFNDKRKEIFGGQRDTTNQRMELTACIKALESLKTSKYNVAIFSDSAYLVNCINKKWYIKWQENGWMNSQKQPVENQDLWKQLLLLYARYTVTVNKVAGHSGHPLNERADFLARQGIAELQKQ
ncbi:MAG: ribonuclease HI [Chitinivibrionales bacterium]|nr:ribonuclease HI [Chitinivibrionales bacterium]